MAGNINWLNKLRGVMERSMMSTLAAKYRRPPWAMRNRYQATVVTPHGKRRCFEATQRTPSGTVSGTVALSHRQDPLPQELRQGVHARVADAGRRGNETAYNGQL
ncbi:hypothetical protein JNW88_20760 [Micromonospora sp. ATA32]|nr:hypothetical protein [Micromonospora sp. ATA32]